MKMFPVDGFIIPIPSAGIPQGLYVPPDRSYRIVPPAGWRILPGDGGEVQFRSAVADRGYWPGMFIAKEPAEKSQLQEETEIQALLAQDRQEFRFISGELLDLPFGKAYLVTYDHTFEKLRMRTAEVHFVQNGARYWAPFNALAAGFDAHFPAYLNCLKSFAPLGDRNDQVRN